MSTGPTTTSSTQTGSRPESSYREHVGEVPHASRDRSPFHTRPRGRRGRRSAHSAAAGACDADALGSRLRTDRRRLRPRRRSQPVRRLRPGKRWTRLSRDPCVLLSGNDPREGSDRQGARSDRRRAARRRGGVGRALLRPRRHRCRHPSPRGRAGPEARSEGRRRGQADVAAGTARVRARKGRNADARRQGLSRRASRHRHAEDAADHRRRRARCVPAGCRRGRDAQGVAPAALQAQAVAARSYALASR